MTAGLVVTLHQPGRFGRAHLVVSMETKATQTVDEHELLRNLAMADRAIGRCHRAIGESDYRGEMIGLSDRGLERFS
jgi:hypothetical protein